MLVDRRAFRRLVQARDLLATDDRPVRDVASAVAISPYHFIRQFEAVFGITPHQFRTELRLAHAKRLLAGGTPVTEVCMEVGFSSLGSFSALFARRVGMPPSAYRRGVQVLTRLQIVPSCLGLLGELPADAFRNFREAARA
ncbi:MAG: helix-turn-helix transcriptional regulator [Deltaproteobacteria bacterium]|nr:helix-turn-helix transcriptional regulator [Deltaproteobacteria bacterium]